jgi:hypothetical protein
VRKCKCTLSQNSHEQKLNSKPAPEVETATVAEHDFLSSPTLYSTTSFNDSPQTPSMMIPPSIGHDISGTYDFNSFDSICPSGVQDLSFQLCNNQSLWNSTTFSCPFNTSTIPETVEASQLDLLLSTMTWSQAIPDDVTNSWFNT